MENEKLTIQHLKGYLGTGLKFQITDHTDDRRGNICELKGIDFRSKSTLEFTTSWGSFCDFEVKPILFPLSSLTKEIEVNGEKFIPLVKHVESFGEPCDDFDQLNLTDYESAVLAMLVNQEMRHQVDVEFLQENKFDYQNLIEKGLAIDVNTLTDNPYTK